MLFMGNDFKVLLKYERFIRGFVILFIVVDFYLASLAYNFGVRVACFKADFR